MTENEIARIIVDAAYKIHTEIGPGLLESAYQALLSHELKKRNLSIKTEVPMPLTYDGIHMDIVYPADIIVEDKVIVELKSIEKISEVHKKQLLTYLKVANKRLGLLINFGALLIRDGISRVANHL